MIQDNSLYGFCRNHIFYEPNGHLEQNSSMPSFKKIQGNIRGPFYDDLIYRDPLISPPDLSTKPDFLTFFC